MTQPPATPEAVKRLEDQFSKLPDSFTALLLETNGAEFGITDRKGDCVRVWACEELNEYNEAYEIQAWLPNCVAIGSDGGDDAILLLRDGEDPETWPVVRVGFGALDPDEFVEQAPTFAAWAERRFELVR